MTTVERLHATGILRIGTPRSGFRYRPANGGRVWAEDLERIAQLKIPPAWTDVAINSATTGRVQVVGQDAAGRWQYLYHESHVRARERKKFARLIRFGENLPKLRGAVTRDLKGPGLSRDRVMASILRILDTSFLRPGSEIYASENGSYGIATLRPRHVAVKGDVIYFDFKGKSGQQQAREIRDRQVARVLRDLLRHSNRRVFKYQNEDGGLVDVTSRTINQSIKELMGRRFTAKDFRTWAGTLICACALARSASDPDLKRLPIKRRIRAAINETAAALGNTPAVSRDAYICPVVISSFERGEVIDSHFDSLERLIAYRGTDLHRAEKALLKLLRKQSEIPGSSVRDSRVGEKAHRLGKNP